MAGNQCFFGWHGKEGSTYGENWSGQNNDAAFIHILFDEYENLISKQGSYCI